MAEDFDKSELAAWCKARVSKFAVALERLITLAEFIVSVDDDSDERRWPCLDPGIFPLIHHVFVEADKAGYLSGVIPWPTAYVAHTKSGKMSFVVYPPLAEAQTPPLDFRASVAGHTMYLEALGPPWRRWGCTSAWFKEQAEVSGWLGREYPEDFPGTLHVIKPRELAMLKDALALVRFPLNGEPTSDQKPEVENPEAEFNSVQLYGEGREPIVNGIARSPLSSAQYKALYALIMACKKKTGTKKPRPSLTEIGKHYINGIPDDSNISRHLKNIKSIDEYWNSAIDTAGVSSGGFYVN